MLTLILDTKTALVAGAEGVELCLKTLIPSLFPFFVVSSVLTSFLPGKYLRIIGFVAGYPVGAQCVSQAYSAGNLSKSSAERMLPCCSNAGPAFLFGIGAGLLPELWMCWLLWGVHILSSFLLSAVTPAMKFPHNKNTYKSVSLNGALRQSMKAISVVCGWVVMFRVILAFAKRWFLWLLPGDWELVISGVLELANGFAALKSVNSIGKCFVLMASFLGFGGICVTMQTFGVISGRGLSGRYYFPGKITQGCISVLLATACQYILSPEQRFFPSMWVIVICAVWCICYALVLWRHKIGGRFSSLVRV